MTFLSLFYHFSITFLSLFYTWTIRTLSNNGSTVPALSNQSSVYFNFTSAGDEWYFMMRVFDGQDWSNWVTSPTIQIHPSMVDTVPVPPINLNAIAGSNQVTLTWEIPTNDGGQPIVEYNIYRRENNNDFIWLASTSQLTFTDTSVQKK
jgi:hypothetical protein